MNSASKLARLALIAAHFHSRRLHLPYLPLRLWVEPTNHCNLRCTVCPNSTDVTSARGFMDLKLYRALIQEIAGQTYDINLSHRGESLFHTDLIEMLQAARSKQIKTRLHTNATILTAKTSRELILSGLNLMSFSFDGFTKQTYESIRRGAEFERVLTNILTFLRQKTLLGSAKPYTILQVIEFGQGDLTGEARQEFLRRFAGLPLDKLYLKQPHNWAGNVDDGCLPAGAVSKPTLSACTFPWYALTVLWDGTVVPCPQDWYGQHPLGNLNRQSLRDVWNGAPMRELRERMSRRQLEGITPCHGCDRVTRETLFGVPRENMKAFLGETVFGYSLVRKLIKR